MTHTLKTVLLAIAASGFWVAVAPASFAAGMDAQALGATVATQMTNLGMTHFDLKALTYNQPLQIETVVQNDDNSADQENAIGAQRAAEEDAMLAKNAPSSAG